MENVFAPKGDRAADYSDPSPVSADTVYLLMSKNFPPEALAWVKRAKWVGPVNIPWSAIDTDDIKGWAASHQPERVHEFEESIRAHNGHVAPSILVQHPDDGKAFIVDGHHRALAHRNLKQDVLGYLGNIEGTDREAAMETHAKQIHSGASPENKIDLSMLTVKLNQMKAEFRDTTYQAELYARAGSPQKELEGRCWALKRAAYPILCALSDAGYDVRPGEFGWSCDQIENTALRKWLYERADSLSF